jgi:hypothetical protein
MESNVLFLSILWYGQSGNHPYKDLAKIGYKLNMKADFLKHLSIVLATYLNHVQKYGGFS